MIHRAILLRNVFLIGLVACVGVSCAASKVKGRLPEKEEILKTLTLANNYFMQKWPDPGKAITTNKTRPSNIWTRAVYYEGLMALYEADPQQRYYDYAVEWGEKHNWGLRDGVETRNADNQAAGQTYIDLYNMEQKPERIQAIKASIDNMVNSEKADDWDWIDALQMAMPVYAKLGVLYNDNAYYEKMYDLFHASKTEIGGGLYNPEDGLWWRDADFVPPYTEPNGEDSYWSRGNGWVAAALARVLDIMPKDAPHREEYEKTYLEMMEALAPLQREDGFWNVSLHDPGHFGGKETSGTALFTYSMAWGVNNGLLDAGKYKPVVVKAWNGMVTDALHPDGFLGYLQGTGKEPKDGQPVTYNSQPDFEDYGLGCFLLAGTEILKMK
ncbi:glycoside hydrolase family 88 protein [Pontibacter sp. 172403-2]|uniref:glycoside hydrolase family 88/105 protein n=1 Tax=Pontibacter rufus TaxID=2791028 RepID=UPI0018AFDE8D|nr:glycoside hydrolase family 88 protein [Pontibacter sp. 172403-2]MBF9255073.1 glycoside hydrolase family 88 protein [Pontibacter sp. 172403-2]